MDRKNFELVLELISNAAIVLYSTNIYYTDDDLEEYLSNKTFYHPIRKKEKEEYAQRKEIFLTDLFEPPEDINGWHIRLASSENSVLYCKRDKLCSISLQPNGKWLRHYGTIQPIGVSIKKEYAETRKEAFSNL